MPKRNRRRWLPVVDAPIQFRFLCLVIVYGAVIMFVMGICLFLPDFISLGDDAVELDTRRRMAETILALHDRFWIPALLVLCLVGIHFFRTFHRVIGPLYRFRWAFERIAEGDLGLMVRIRDDDLLHREEKCLNEMISALSMKVKAISEGAHRVTASLDELEKFLSQRESRQGDAGTERLLFQQRKAVQDLMDGISVFRLRDM